MLHFFLSFFADVLVTFTRKVFFVKNVLTPILFKSVLPAALTAFGTVVAVLWSEGFRAFCGL